MNLRMLQVDNLKNRDESVGVGNPYAADRELASGKERQIEKPAIRPKAIQKPIALDREFSPDQINALQKVKSGLQYYYSGIYLVTFCFFVGSLLGQIFGPQVKNLLAFGTTLGILIVLIGEIRCLRIPRNTGGYIHVILSVFFYTLGVLMYFIKRNLEANDNATPEIFLQLGILQLIFGFLANFFFLTFIICLTRFLKNPRLYQKAIKTRQAIWSMIGFIFIVMLVFVIMVNQLPKNGLQLAFVVFGIGVIGFVVLFYSWLNRFTRLVQETCSAIHLD